MKRIENICYVQRDNEPLCLDLYLPDESVFDVFVYFHGGGLERGHKANATVNVIAPWLAAHGIAVAAADYRKYPNAKYPDFVRDAAAAVHWISCHIGEYGGCKRLFVGGSSAGAYLSMMLCFDARWYGECGAFPIPVSGYFHDAGQPTAHFNVLRERGIDPRRVIVDDTAPLYHISDKRDYPPMMFAVADDDMKCRFEQIQLVLATLRHFGYDERKLSYRLMQGRHCSYNRTIDENGGAVFGKMIKEWIEACQA